MILVSDLTNTVANSTQKNNATVYDIRKTDVSNGISVDTDSTQPKQETNTVFDFVKSKRLLLTSLIMWFAW